MSFKVPACVCVADDDFSKLREFINMGGSKWLCAYLTQCSHQLQRANLE